MNRYVLRAVRALSGPASSPVLNAWSNPATWAGMGGLPPQAGDSFTIGPGDTYTLDTLTNSLGQLTINGTLLVSSKVDSTLIADRVTIGAGGRYVSGAAGSPNQRRHRLTLTEHPLAGVLRGAAYSGNTSTGNVPTDCRGLIVMGGGSLEVYGYVPPVTKTFIQGHHYAGAKTLTLAADVSASWVPGDEIAVFPTGFYRPDRREEIFTIQSVSGNTVTLASTTGLGYDRWGLLQYMTNVGMSLTPDAYTLSSAGGKKADASMHDSLDQRARVVLLSRRHRMDSPEDDEKLTLRHGHQFMTMVKPGDGGKTVVWGLESKRGGQGGRLGAYPFHCHANSIVPNTSTNLGPLADGQVEFRDCVTNQSFNRAFTFHACQNVANYNFTAVSFMGHGVFNESGAELGNTLYYADVAGAYDPGDGFRILDSDTTNSDANNSRGASGLWLTNLHNRLKGNRFCSSLHGGWISLSKPYGTSNSDSSCSSMPTDSIGGCVGIATKIAIYPYYCPPLEWTDNVFHSNRFLGKQFQANATDSQNSGFANTERSFTPVAEMVPTGTTYIVPNFDGDVMWKNAYAGYNNGVAKPLYTRQLAADNGAGQAVFEANGDHLYYDNNQQLTPSQVAAFANDHVTPVSGGYKQHGVGNDFAGVVQDGGIGDRVTFIDTSLNNWDSPTEANRQRIAFDSYHYTIIFKNITVFGYETTSPPTYESRFREVIKTRAVNGSWDFYLNPIEFSSRGMVNWNHIGNGPMLYMAPGPNLSAQAPFSDWYPAGTGGEHQGSRKHSFAASIADWWGTIFKQGPRRYGSPDIPFITYDDPNSTPLLAADGGSLAMVTTSTMHVAINSGAVSNGAGFWFDAQGNDLAIQDNLYQRCAVSDFSDYLVTDARGRKAQWLMSGFANSGESSLNNWGGSGGGAQYVSFPIGSVVRLYNPTTPVNVASFKTDNPGTNDGGLKITETVGTEWVVLGVAMDLTKTISGSFNGVSFTNSARLADLKSSTVSTIWKDSTVRTGAPNGTVWMKLCIPAGSATSGRYEITLPIRITAT